MDGEVSLAHIMEAHAARTSAYERHEKGQENDERMEFQFIKNSLSPQLYDSKLEWIRQRCTTRAGEWLEKDEHFLEWQDHSNELAKVLWLTGIPGAGISVALNLLVEKELTLRRQNISVTNNCEQAAGPYRSSSCGLRISKPPIFSRKSYSDNSSFVHLPAHH